MLLFGFIVLPLGLACANAEVGGSPGSGGFPGGGSSGGEGGSGIKVDLDASVVVSGPDLGGAEPLPDLKGYQCDDAGNCTLCQPVRILSLGQPASKSYGASGGDNTNAFQDFMNSNSKGTATMKMQTTFMHIPALDLGQYDVVILQALYDNPYDPNVLWKFDDTDAATLRDWVRNKGGAIIAMSGYYNDNAVEIQPLNQLLNGSDNWSGITYNPDNSFNDSSCANYCSYCSVPFDGWTTTYADFDQITRNLKKVGIYFGRSINCTGSDCQVFAKDSTFGNVGVAKAIGKGRLVAWGDEWVTYTSQWGLTPDPQYDDTTKYAQCVGHTPMTSYTVPQFWYNVFRWVAQTSCLTIVVPPTAGVVPQIIY